jgi:membrane dipeptidase
MLTIDAHCDTLYLRAMQPGKQPCVTPERLRAGGVALQICALWAGPEGPAGDPAGNVRAQLDAWARLQGDGQGAGLRAVQDPADAVQGEAAAMLSIEGGEVFAEDIESVSVYRALGVRLAALTWNHENAIAHPAADGPEGGIKPFGWKILAEMERLGMAADVSHLNRRGFFDLIERHGKPPIASHSCCDALCPHFRNLTDQQIRALIRRGGWIGVNFYPTFLVETGEATLQDVVRHIDHIAQLGGAAHVGFGSDFDGIERTPAGLSSPADVPALLDALAARGYDPPTLRAIAGENFLRYFERIRA